MNTTDTDNPVPSTVLDTVSCSGLLYVGDPHLTSRCPGRRLEGEDFKHVALDKLRQAFDLANEKNYTVVILGDLFDRSKEMDPVLLSGLFTILAGSKQKPLCLAGNHDLTETTLKEDATLSVVEATQMMTIIKSAGVVAYFDIDGQTIGLGGTPYGMEIPIEVLWDRPVDAGFWITHEDLAFPGGYPGAKPFVEIKGVDFAVNGHMHLAQTPMKFGQTTWHNPGNILRLTLDAKFHEPAVLAWTTANGFKKAKLKYNPDVFNMLGKQLQTVSELAPSVFVDLLKQDAAESSDVSKSMDGSFLNSKIEELFNEEKPSKAAQQTLINLFNLATQSEITMNTVNDDDDSDFSPSL